MSQIPCSVTEEEYLHMHVCMILYMWRPAGRKTRVETLTNDNYVSEKIVANFLNRIFRRLDVKALEKHPCPAAQSLWR